jgi:hypothetical protein
MLLQFREIAPQDYHLLLVLDPSANPKTAPPDVLDALGTMDASAADLEGELCAVCMQPLEHGDSTLAVLPCSHSFHRTCIREWLSRCSTKCPTDGLPIF